MRTLLELLRRLTGSLRRGRTDADLQEELRAHLEFATEREAARGHSWSDATRRARLRAGSIAHALEPLRDQRGLPWLDGLRADVVFGWRQIVRHRIVSVAAVLSLCLSLGAALAAFRLVDAVLLRPLPVMDPSRLFVVTKTSLNVEQVAEERDDFDYPTYRRYVERARAHADLMLGVWRSGGTSPSAPANRNLRCSSSCPATCSRCWVCSLPLAAFLVSVMTE